MNYGKISAFELGYELSLPEELRVGSTYRALLRVTEVAPMDDGDWEVTFVVEEIDT
jgi:hypothetical protein